MSAVVCAVPMSTSSGTLPTLEFGGGGRQPNFPEGGQIQHTCKAIEVHGHDITPIYSEPSFALDVLKEKHKKNCRIYVSLSDLSTNHLVRSWKESSVFNHYMLLIKSYIIIFILM